MKVLFTFKTSAAHTAAVRVALIYAGFSLLWIFFSDRILFYLSKDAEMLTRIQMLKGWAFVIVTAFIVYVLLHREITKVKQNEGMLRQSTRAYKILSECNQTLVHAKDEPGLLEDVCREIVNTGGYRLAWIGLAEHDRKRTVRPVAHSGYEAGYLDTLNITWADTQRGQGPTGMGDPFGTADHRSRYPERPHI